MTISISHSTQPCGVASTKLSGSRSLIGDDQHFLTLKFKNINTAFDPISYASFLEGYSFAEIVCLRAIKSAVLERREEVRELDLPTAANEISGGWQGETSWKSDRSQHGADEPHPDHQVLGDRG
jgi:hypothetical protein